MHPDRKNHVLSRYAGLLVTKTMLNSNHHKFVDLENIVLVNICHSNRLNLALVPAPSGTMTTQGQIEQNCLWYQLHKQYFQQNKVLEEVHDM